MDKINLIQAAKTSQTEATIRYSKVSPSLVEAITSSQKDTVIKTPRVIQKVKSTQTHRHRRSEGNETSAKLLILQIIIT